MLPPFLNQEIINLVKEVKENTSLNVATLSTAQWYRLLLEKEIMEVSDTGVLEPIKTRTERNSLDTDWETSWRRVRLKGIGSEATTFLWKMVHNLLPTEARLARILKNSSEICKLCPTPKVADLQHCLFECNTSKDIGEWLLYIFRLYDRTVNATRLIKLDFKVEGPDELPFVWFLSHTLLHVWNMRRAGKISSIATTRAVLERKISILRKTRYGYICDHIEMTMSNNL